MLFYHFISLEDGYLYELMLDTPLSKGEEDYQLFKECVKYFRVVKSNKECRPDWDGILYLLSIFLCLFILCVKAKMMSSSLSSSFNNSVLIWFTLIG